MYAPMTQGVGIPPIGTSLLSSKILPTGARRANKQFAGCYRGFLGGCHHQQESSWHKMALSLVGIRPLNEWSATRLKKLLGDTLLLSFRQIAETRKRTFLSG